MNPTVSVILPIHEINETIEKLFSNAIKSIENQIVKPAAVLVVHTTDEKLKTFLTGFDFGEIKNIVSLVENNESSDFCGQINFAANKVTTTHFSVLEFDDEYSKIWFKNVDIYLKAYPDFKIFLPIIIDTDVNNNFLDLTNQPVWAAEFSEQMGVIDNDTLLIYQNFNIDGMVINTETYKSVGGLKSNIKLTFIYEFLLRLTYNDFKIMVVPKLGYKHINQRPGSLFNNYKNTLDEQEAKFWINTAKKEYYFKNPRQITYDSQAV